MHRNKKNKNKNKHRNRSHREKENKGEDQDEKQEEETTSVEEPALPYTIECSDVMGRYLIASRDLPRGEVLMTVAPLVVGPCQGTAALCLGCYTKLLGVETAAVCCKGCDWPMCGVTCPGVNGVICHGEAECRLLATAKLKPKDDNTMMRYHTIVPLRCLLLKTTSPDQWTQLMTMESHNALRRVLPHWRTNQVEIVDRIRQLWGMTQYSEDEIHTVCGILEVNAFEVGQHGTSVRALYPCAFLIAHDCTPNTCHTDSDDFRLSVRTASAINKGATITLSYAYTLQGTLKRREHLRESKFFDCCCVRCADPTELRTFAGALKCPKCRDGNVLSTAPLDAQAQWKCTAIGCPGYDVSAASVVSLMSKINDEVDAIDVNDVQGYESLLTRYRNVLHPNHYHCLGVKHSLSQLYGKSKYYHINQMTDEQLTRKRDICKEILKVFDILEPGYSRLRGTTLYELHAPIMILTQRQLERQAITKNELRARLCEVTAYLEEASLILRFEPASSNEGSMGSAAVTALAGIKEWQKLIGRT